MNTCGRPAQGEDNNDKEMFEAKPEILESYRAAQIDKVEDPAASRIEMVSACQNVSRGQPIPLLPSGNSGDSDSPKNLAHMYWKLFGSSSNLGDLDKAILYQNEAICSTHDDQPDKPESLNDLGLFHKCRFDRLRDSQDFDKAIEFHARAVDLVPDSNPDKPLWLSNLGVTYQERFESLGDLEDLDKARVCQEQVVLLARNNDPGKPMWLSNLGLSYQASSEYLGEPENLERAINCLQQAVQLTPDENTEKSAWLTNLSKSYCSRFERLGNIADVDEAISCQQRAILLTPDDHLVKPIQLNNLGGYYFRRFEHLNDIEDIENSVSCNEQAILLVPDTSPSKPVYLSNLGSSYRKLFDCFEDLKDIAKSITCLEQALLLTPGGDPEKPARLGSLGTSYWSQFKSLKSPDDINKAISYGQQSVLLTPDNNVNKPMWLNCLANSYHSRFTHLRNLADIDLALDCSHQAVLLCPEDHSGRPMLLNELVTSHMRRYAHRGTQSDLASALTYIKEAALSPTGRPTTRFNASRRWAVLADSSSLEAYKQSMMLLPQVVWLGASVERRYRYLISDIRDLVTKAAAAAISSAQYDLALEWLEEGRSVIWNQMLQLRTPLDELTAVKPDLAKELQQIAQSLEQASSLPAVEIAPLLNSPSLEEAAQKHRRLAATWGRLLDQARRVPGFHDFLRAKKFTEIAHVAQSSTVVVINVHTRRCDAIILQPGSTSPLHVPLRLFSFEKAMKARAQLLGSLQDNKARTRDNRRPLFYSGETQDHFEDVLATLWTDVVKPILEFLGYLPGPPGSDLPHIIWCTTGPLTNLPLHAAGCYGEPKARTFNYVISSYTPTLSALLRPVRATSGFHGMLAVGQSAATSNAALPGTIVELNQVQEQAGQLPFTRLDGNSATSAAVLSALQEHSWVHLACHASQNAHDPTSSAFLLHGGDLSLAAITQKELKHADFAFLSACQTAMGDKKLPDEVLHLAAGMMMVGFSSVVATMWSIKDQDAPAVAKNVYSTILEGGVPNGRKAAKALHNAVGHLRDQIGEKEFARWVPYIHMGH